MKKSSIIKGALLAVILLAVVLIPLFIGSEEPAAEGGGFYGTGWALLPPVVAIALALITKEVYSSLFVGILMGGLLYSGYNFEGTVLHVFQGGIISVLSDGYNIGILVFLVILGAMVSLMNRAGGSAAFGRWAARHIKTRVGAQLATVALGVLIFIDDYFNCLTVGSVMRPVTDKHKISRVKLAYLIDATAAPVCIIAPISSWAAAVASYVEDGSGLNLFIKAIPFNFYAILTIVMMVGMAIMKTEFGSMAKFEENAIEKGDIFGGKNPYANTAEEGEEQKGIVLDLVLPIVVLIVSCVIGMIYSGDFFNGASFVEAFSNSDASVGLMLGSVFALAFTIIYYCLRRTMTFRQTMECLPEGFRAMVPAILILTFAWSLKAMTDSLGAKAFVEGVVKGSAQGFQSFLPAVVFLIGCFLAFATGTSWGTFGILIPITLSVFPLTDPLGVVCVSACMAGAVCGDHCSPISDTTIMASAGAQCDHVAHVSTQLPYAVVAAAVSFVSYIIAGFVPNALIVLPIAIVLMIGTLFVIKIVNNIKTA
ncbi:Na+/H+ antiporter NhaC family protein [Acutalibacter sp. 1XD8-36]|uniref:Na+/H+ antiporter NhaC family protein n=1 Tax=Acutalibacter sp. 1XD8-36 TaxID=2320852 RepID=UPI00262E2059|nr:Na+/H+ antiporter NhaC family protein [Acutalibacter sp. 1XD8-36]